MKEKKYYYTEEQLQEANDKLVELASCIRDGFLSDGDEMEKREVMHEVASYADAMNDVYYALTRKWFHVFSDGSWLIVDEETRKGGGYIYEDTWKQSECLTKPAPFDEESDNDDGETNYTILRD